MADAAEAAKAMGDDLFDEKNEVPSNWIAFTKVGDYFKGTLLRRELVDNKLNPGKKQWVYEFKMHYGEFHKQDGKNGPVIEPGVVINADEVWMLGSKESIDKQMRNIKLGQIVGMRLTEISPAQQKGFNDFKNVKVYNSGLMDESFMSEPVEHGE